MKRIEFCGQNHQSCEFTSSVFFAQNKENETGKREKNLSGAAHLTIS
jgi:hypothetical protein